MYNINAGHNEALKEACEPLYEYCWLVERIRKGMEPVENKRDPVILGRVVEEALKAMPESFRIRKMLMDEMEEVKGMIFGEYDEALDRQEQEKYLQEETDAARSEGEKIGEEKGKVKGTKQKTVEIVKNLLKKTPEWTDQEIADVVKDITAEEVAKLRKGEKPE